MNPPRETIYAALATLLSSLQDGPDPLFKEVQRRLLHWSDATPATMPSCYTVQVSETVQFQGKNFPNKWMLKVELYIYVSTGGDSESVPSSILNPILDAVEAALAPNPDGGKTEQTLGGLVEWCRIDGTIETDEGVLGDKAVAIVPVSILVP